MKNKSGENFISLIICLVVMLIFSIVTISFNIILGIVQLICVFLLSLLSILVVKKNHEHFSDYIENLTFHVDNATKESLIYAPMPVIIFKNDGKALWYNSAFYELYGEKEFFDANISEVFQGITKDIIFKQKKTQFQCTIDDRKFLALTSTIRFDKKDETTTLSVVYLFDNTEGHTYKKLNEENRPVFATVSIDNYDDVLINTPETHRSLFVAEIENRIYNWFEFTNAIIKKIERDKYLIIFKNKYLNEMISRKFSILDVKEVKCGNKFSATLSIGIGVADNKYHLADEYSNSAMTLALGRGGDQVVIKNQENVSYYGGKTREHEKTTKVKARVTALALKELMSHASNVLVMGHKYPDMDSIGAAIGICAFAKSINVPVNLIYDYTSSSVNQILERVVESCDYEGVVISNQVCHDFIRNDTLIVVVDTHRPAYTENPGILTNTNNIVIIDHHRRGAEFIENTRLVYHEPYASSTCEMVAELLQYVGDELKFTAHEAEAVYAGIMTDTKDFAMKTGVRTFEAAAFLKRYGVDIGAIRRFFRNDFNSFVKVAKVVAGAEVVCDNIAISECKKIEGIDIRPIVPQAADKLLSISGIEASFVILPLEDETIISGRSTGNINVQLILEKLGGGGHQTMSGVQLSPCTYEDAKNMLLKAIKEYMEEQDA